MSAAQCAALNKKSVPHGLEKCCNELLKELLNKEKWAEKFSEKYVGEVLKDSMFSILRSGIEKAKESFDKICSDIESYCIEQTVYIREEFVSLGSLRDWLEDQKLG
ncbi:MAG: hypothetical protein HC881_11570 [Leptolyngbyaceae cyanobacterium SL_7_1]|nr:hypothetical protein [Leptolyngbyaceae cyanobacterium SL_7_1]